MNHIGSCALSTCWHAAYIACPADAQQLPSGKCSATDILIDLCKSRARQYVPIAEYKTTLESMVQVARAGGVKNILLISPPPIDEAARIVWNQQVWGGIDFRAACMGHPQ